MDPDNKVDYKETLFLPKTDFPMRAGLPAREPQWLDRWEKLKIYSKLRAKVGDREKFILHDGPPYANGNLHIGHALNKILKDIVTRSQQMLGKDASYIPGWDCHGLPIEWKIEERYRSSGKSKDEISTIELRKECRKFASEWVQIQKDEFKRLGVIGDWENPYLTMDYYSEAIIAEEFMKFITNGSLYQGSKPVMWSPVEKTALAEAEVEYHDIKSYMIWVKFKTNIDEFMGASIVIWTTTPWTIPSNKAVAYGKNISYGLYEVLSVEDESLLKPGEKIIIADDLYDYNLKNGKVTELLRLKSINNETLSKISLEHPLRNLPGSDGYWNYEVPMVEAEFVTTDSGTGFVHMAPSHGLDDYEVFVKLGWTEKMTNNVTEDSSFADHVPVFRSMRIINDKGKEGEANKEIINRLIENGNLMSSGRFVHSYPHSWRSKSPIIFRNTPQWFVNIDKKLDDNMYEQGNTIRERALNSIEKLVTWTPNTGKNRLFSMIKERPDWVLSRQRVWGVPLTCFVRKSEDGSLTVLQDKQVNESIIKAFKEEGADCWFDDEAKERFLGAKYDHNEWQKVNDILDVWFDSGSTHAFVLRDRDDSTWPADLYLEGTDQHRGWFHSSMLQSCGTKGQAPYKGVLTHGFTLDEKGMKMSKSQNNITSPEKVIKQYGADILRLWVAQSDYSVDQRIGQEILKGVSDSYRKLRNTLRFILGNLDGFNEKERVKYDQLPEIEQWVLNRIIVLDERIRAGYEGYAFQSVAQQIFQFCSSDLSAFYFDIRKDALYCSAPEDKIRRSSRTVLDILFYYISSWIAPILVFTAEEVWLSRFSGTNDSIHLTDFPYPEKVWKVDCIEERWNLIRDLRKVVSGAIEISRQEKLIGASLEAHPYIYINSKEKVSMLNGVDLAEICISSGATLILDSGPENAFSIKDIPDIKVVCQPAKGEKCLRCWKILPEVEQSFEKKVCQRCSNVLMS